MTERPLLSNSGQIEGVEPRELKTFKDERGFFREAARVDLEYYRDGIADLSHLTLHPGHSGNWLLYSSRVCWCYVPAGVILIEVCDLRKTSATARCLWEIVVGDNQAAQVLKIPAGVAFRYRASEATSQLVVFSNESQLSDHSPLEEAMRELVSEGDDG